MNNWSLTVIFEIKNNSELFNKATAQNFRNYVNLEHFHKNQILQKLRHVPFMILLLLNSRDTATLEEKCLRNKGFLCEKYKDSFCFYYWRGQEQTGSVLSLMFKKNTFWSSYWQNIGILTSDAESAAPVWQLLNQCCESWIIYLGSGSGCDF